MSKMFDKDGFEIVCSKKRHGKKASNSQRKIASFAQSLQTEPMDKTLILKTISDRKKDICDSEFCASVLSVINSEMKVVRQIVCYGLGSFSTCSSSSFQLALLLILQEEFLCDISIYDPVFTDTEKCILRNIGINVLVENDECKHKAIEPTLFYMIHCGKPMYNNVLCANWNIDSLKNVFIMGNSFNHIELFNSEKLLKAKLRYIYNVLPYTIEIDIPNTFKFDDVFNNTSLHYFCSEKLSNLEKSVWCLNIDPEYDSDDEIIRKLDVLKL